VVAVVVELVPELGYQLRVAEIAAGAEQPAGGADSRAQ